MGIKLEFSDFYIGGGFYATTLEFQIGRLWMGVKYSQYWLFSTNRAKFLSDADNRAWSKRCSPTPSRSWLFAWPGFVRICRKEDS